MKELVCFLCCICAVSFNVSAQSLSPEDMGDKVIDAFLKENFECYKKLLIDSADYQEFAKDFLKVNYIEESEKKKLLTKNDLLLESIVQKHKMEFNRLLQLGKDLGIVWKQITKARFTYTLSNLAGSNKKALTGEITFYCNNEQYIFCGIEAMRLSSVCKLISIGAIQKGQ